MNLPDLRTRQDVCPFVASLLDREELSSLVEAFSDGPDGLESRIEELEASLIAEVGVGSGLRGGSAAGGGDEAGDEHGLGGEAPGTWSVAEEAQARLIIDRWKTAASERVTAAPADVAGGAAWLSDFAKGRWDLRLGRERDSIPSSGEMFSARVTDAIYTLAHSWGMYQGEPPSGHFDCALVLGGLVKANITRPRVLADLLAGDAIAVDTVVGLGSNRPMTIAERELGFRLGCRGRTEVEALECGLVKALGSPESRWVSTPVEGVKRLSARIGPRVFSASAPDQSGGRRPNTGEAFDWFVRGQDAGIECGSSILSVTTPIYWLQNHAALLARVPGGVHLTTTGGVPKSISPSLGQAFLAQHYLQEIKASIDAMLRLLSWVEH